ncbi:Gmad2 immunoglobulin-like domain-containing protein [Pseudalkalibacillus sp. SCS-8]|uniref:Gmad2 immunoglobulin-like domain-containing protein n=1 Tax=Pseudalkalibacillus nanhaiensis TaxID=3115291 RepID=UPI0032DB3D31
MLIILLIVLLGIGGYQWITNDSDSSSDPPASEDQGKPDDESDGKDGPDDDATDDEPVENDAFKIESPRPNQVVGNEFLFKGKARVFEAVFQYELKDGDQVLEEDFIITSEGAPAWGTFEKTISVPADVTGPLVLKIFVESAKDGSEVHVLEIPLKTD